MAETIAEEVARQKRQNAEARARPPVVYSNHFDESETETAEQKIRRVAPSGYFWKKEDFAACFSETNAANGQWLEGRWAAYQAEVAFIRDVYDDQALRQRLYAHINPKGGNWDDDCTWIGECENALVEANRKGKPRTDDCHPDYGLMDASKAAAGYLAAPRKFHTRKADAFFARVALAALICCLENEIVEGKMIFKFYGAIAVSTLLVILAVNGGWAAFSGDTLSQWLTGIGQLILFGSILWMLCQLVKWLFTAAKRRSFAPAERYRAIASELYTQSFDPETIIDHLKGIEADTGIQIPTYIFTLLKRAEPELAQ
jgi:hypothetical protein